MRLTIRLGLGLLGRVIGGRIEVERIGGNLLSRPELSRVRIVFQSDSVTIERVSFDYDLLGNLRGRVGLRVLRIERPQVFLAGRRPGQATKVQTQPAGRFPRIGVRRLVLEAGTVSVDGRPIVDSVAVLMSAESRSEQVRAFLHQASLLVVPESVRISQLSAQMRVTADSALLEGMRLAADGFSFAGTARVGLADGGFTAAFMDLEVDLARFAGVPGRFKASGQGGVTGGDPSARVGWSASGLRWRGLALPELFGRLTLADSLASLTMMGRNPELGGVEFDGYVHIGTQAFAGRLVVRDLAIRRLEPTLPEVRITGSCDVGGKSTDSIWGTLRVTVPALGFDSLTATGGLVRGGVVIERLTARGASGRLSGQGRYRTGSGFFEIIADNFDLGVAAVVGNAPVSGRLNGLLTLTIENDSLHLLASLYASQLSFQDVTANAAVIDVNIALGKQLAGRVAVGGEVVRFGGQTVAAAQLVWDEPVFELRVDLDRSRLFATGDLAVERNGFAADFANFDFVSDDETLMTARPFRLNYSAATGLELTGLQFELGGGQLTAQGKIKLTDVPEPDFEVTARGLDLASVAKLGGIGFEVRGKLDASLHFDSLLRCDIAMRDLAVPEYGLVLRSVEGRLGLDGDTLSVDRLWLVRIDSAGSVDTSRITGRLVLMPRAPWPVQKVDLMAELVNVGPWVLVFLRPTLVAQRASIYGSLRVGGNLIEPELYGRLRLARADLSVEPIKASLQRVNGELTFAGNRVNIQKLTGRSRRGTVSAGGFVELGPGWVVDTLHLEAAFSGIEASPLRDVYGIAGGEIMLDWRQPQPIALSGRIDVEEALITIDPGQPAVTGGTPDTTLVYDLRIRGERGIWWRSSLADIELGVDMSIRRTMQEEFYNGELVSRQGNVYYFDRTLRVTSGTVRFANLDRLNPELDITAEMLLHGNGGSGDTPEKIVLTVTGTIETPQLEFRSEPPGWDNLQIVSYLSLNATPEQLREIDSRAAVTRMLSDRLLGFFQTRVAQRARGFTGLDYLDFETGLTSDARTRLTVGKYIGRRLYISYTQFFDEGFDPAFRVEYYLDRRNELVAARDENGRLSLRYRFRLRY